MSFSMSPYVFRERLATPAERHNLLISLLNGLDSSMDHLQTLAAAHPELLFHLQVGLPHDPHHQKQPDENNWPLHSGFVFAIPLTRDAWEKFLNGKVDESTLDLSMVPHNSMGAAGAGIGIHVLSIQPDAPLFLQSAIMCMRRVAERKNWRTMGFSAMAVSGAVKMLYHNNGLTSTGCEQFLCVRETETEGEKRRFLFRPGQERIIRAKWRIRQVGELFYMRYMEC